MAWPSRTVAVILAVVAVAVLAKAATLVFVVGALSRACGDPLDRQQVLQVVDGGSGSIVAADYVHAESSARVLAFWLVAGPPPAVGSREPVCGHPAAVWLGSRASVRATWSADAKPLLVLSARPARTVTAPFMTACYFGSGPAGADTSGVDASGAMLCYDAGRIEVSFPPGTSD